MFQRTDPFFYESTFAPYTSLTMSNCYFFFLNRKREKKILKRRLLKILPRALSVISIEKMSDKSILGKSLHFNLIHYFDINITMKLYISLPPTKYKRFYRIYTRYSVISTHYHTYHNI